MKIQSAKAGIGTGRAGLQAASGLFSSAGLFDKGVKSFNPLDLDPYLLFDARTSMIGTLENPTLDLDPSKQDTLDVITATRAGVATFTDVNGLIASAPANTVRVDYVDSVPMILVEPSATNLVTYSEDFSQWVESGDIETFSNFTVSPNGTQNATKLELTGSSSGTDGKISFPVSTVSQTHTFSVYAKKGSHNYIYIWMAITGGNITRWINLDDGSHSGNGTATLTTTEVGNDWWRIEYTFDATNLYNIRLEVAENFTSTGTGGDNVYIWGAQLEAGSVATSYIPTAGGDAAARTRAADDLVITGSDFSDFYNQSEGTVYFEAQKRDAGSIYNFTIGDGTTSNRIPVEHNFVSVTQGGIGQAPTNITLPNNEIYRLAVTLKNNDSKVSVNGGNEVNVASPTLPTSTGITIGGRQDDTNAQKLNGHIKRLVYWPYHSDNL